MSNENSVASWSAQACRSLTSRNCPSQNSAPPLSWQVVLHVFTVSVWQLV